MHRRTNARPIEPEDFLLPDPARRSRPAATPPRPTLIEDAVFEVVGPARQAYRRSNDNPPPRRHDSDPKMLPLLARLGGRFAAALEKRLATLSPQAFFTLLTSLVLLVFWICGGFSALAASQSGHLPTQPFMLVDTSIRTQDANGMKLAVVSGGVRNTSGRIIDAPRLAIVTGSRQEVIGTVMLEVAQIGPGVTIPFAGRFKLAGGKSSDIAIIPRSH